jgi:branched-chain amino acid transport system ATP-binding protein
MTPILQCTNVRKTYGGVVALHDVNLDVHAGEILGLVGANGSGKSTLLDLICGTQPVDRGEILFQGRSLIGASTAEIIRRGIARTFQLPQVARELTILENVMCGLGPRHLSGLPKIIWRGALGMVGMPVPEEREVVELCSQLGLGDLDREVERISFGEMRLVEVARALIQQPAVLLLDEPFPGVDDEGLGAVLEALSFIGSRGTAVVLIDHNVDIVASAVDRIVLLADGEIVIDGDPSSCVKNPIFLERYIGVV